MAGKMIKKYFNFTEQDISAGKYTAWELIQPLWWNVSIYDGLDVYNKNLEQFSESQRKMFALNWYDAEVCNGGHDQFFCNSTGIVWKDALEGFRMVGADSLADNFQKAVDMFEGSVPFDREERQEMLEKITRNPDYDENDEESEEYLDVFDELDRFYYDNEDFYELMDIYVKNHPKEFVLKGEFEVWESENKT